MVGSVANDRGRPGAARGESSGWSDGESFLAPGYRVARNTADVAVRELLEAQLVAEEVADLGLRLLAGQELDVAAAHYLQAGAGLSDVGEAVDVHVVGV